MSTYPKTDAAQAECERAYEHEHIWIFGWLPLGLIGCLPVLLDVDVGFWWAVIAFPVSFAYAYIGGVLRRRTKGLSAKVMVVLDEEHEVLLARLVADFAEEIAKCGGTPPSCTIG